LAKIKRFALCGEMWSFCPCCKTWVIAYVAKYGVAKYDVAKRGFLPYVAKYAFLPLLQNVGLVPLLQNMVVAKCGDTKE